MKFPKNSSDPLPENETRVGEVGKTYYGVAQVACALSSYIRHLGFPARAHHLRNEQIFQVPHAVDAGLGEQGRLICHGQVWTQSSAILCNDSPGFG